MSPPLLATAVLLLATGRTWTAHRDTAERFALGTLSLLASRLLCACLPAPWGVALLPIIGLAVILAVQVAAAWRFEPDTGQRGWTWAFTPALPRTLGPSLALGAVLPIALGWLEAEPHAFGPALLVAAALYLGHALQTRLILAARSATVRLQPRRVSANG